mmetsp:Transcript_26115/g.60892  ORF Transcript_26115/g.60892 Transcript_26115/m.60892 type:complete len:223 (+) Transcript_26115:279-947(+)
MRAHRHAPILITSGTHVEYKVHSSRLYVPKIRVAVRIALTSAVAVASRLIMTVLDSIAMIFPSCTTTAPNGSLSLETPALAPRRAASIAFRMLPSCAAWSRSSSSTGKRGNPVSCSGDEAPGGGAAASLSSTKTACVFVLGRKASPIALFKLPAFRRRYVLLTSSSMNKSSHSCRSNPRCTSIMFFFCRLPAKSASASGALLSAMNPYRCNPNTSAWCSTSS